MPTKRQVLDLLSRLAQNAGLEAAREQPAESTADQHPTFKAALAAVMEGLG